MDVKPELLARRDWYFDQDGYEIIEWMETKFDETYEMSAGFKDTFSPVRYLVGRGGPLKEYPIFSAEQPIHRDFADVKNDEEAIAFCGKYGLLELALQKGWETSSWPPQKSIAEDKNKINYGKIRETTRGRAFFERPEAALLDRFWWHHVRVKGAIESLEKGEMIWAVRSFNMASIEVIPQIDYQETRLNQSWSLVPKNLISAIWLLFENEISGNKKWQRCKNCQSWFMPATARAEYCKTACKQAWHRKQKKGV